MLPPYAQPAPFFQHPMMHAPMMHMGMDGQQRRLKAAAVAQLGEWPMITPSQMALWKQDIRLDVTAAEWQLGLSWTPLSDTLAYSALR